MSRLGVSTVMLALLVLPTAYGERDSKVPFDQVCLVTTAGNVNATEEARNAVPLDTPVGATRVGGTHFVLFGLHRPFHALEAQVGQAGTAGTMVWLYSTSTGWEEVGATGAVDLDAPGAATIGFHRPHGWAPHFGECGASLYYLKGITRTPYTVIPILDSARARV